jgi:hypothetical protein
MVFWDVVGHIAVRLVAAGDVVEIAILSEMAWLVGAGVVCLSLALQYEDYGWVVEGVGEASYVGFGVVFCDASATECHARNASYGPKRLGSR